MSLALESFMDILFWSNVRAAVLVVLVLAVLAVLRAASGEVRHGIWLTAIAGCLALPIVSALLPVLAIPILPPEAPTAVANLVPSELVPISRTDSPAPLAPISPALIVISVYALGALLVLGWFAVALGRVARLERRMSAWSHPQAIELKDSICRELGIGRPVQLLENPAAASPFTWGASRPRIALPAAAEQWSGDRLRNVLRHELCHVRRLDWLRLVLERLAAAVYWFNPLMWIAIRRSRYEAERACDECVLESGGHSSAYAEQLVDLMSFSRESRSVGIALGDSDFARRIRSILNSPEEAPAMTRLKSRTLTAGTAIAALMLSACQITSGQPSVAAVDDAAGTDQSDPIVARATQVQPQPAIPVRAQRDFAEAEARQQAERAERELVRSRGIAEREAVAAERQREVIREERERVVRAAASAEAAAQNQEERFARMAEELEVRSLALRESRSLLDRQERALRELQASLDQQTEALVAMERELTELRARLDGVDVE